MSKVSQDSGPTTGESSKNDFSTIQASRDSSQAQITTVKFDGSNYLVWSKSVLIYIQGKDKEQYLIDEIEITEKTDPKFRKWKTKNATVMRWLLSFMKPEISYNFFVFRDNTSNMGCFSKIIL